MHCNLRGLHPGTRQGDADMLMTRPHLFAATLACLLPAVVFVSLWVEHPAERATLLTRSQLEASLGGDTGTGNCQVPDTKACGLTPATGTQCPNVQPPGTCQASRLPGGTQIFCIKLALSVNGVCKDDNTSSRLCTLSIPGGQCGSYSTSTYAPVDGCGLPGQCPAPDTACGDAKTSATQGDGC